LAHVLLVTDDVEGQQVWPHVLKRHGLEAVAVGLAGSHLEGWEQCGFDLVLVDASGARDRLDVCRRLRSGGVNPILLLVPECDERICIDVYRAGADECIQKPASPAILVAKVRAWLRQSWTIRADAPAPLGAAGAQM
jgi:DNA-binding response OmpR family regulator